VGYEYVGFQLSKHEWICTKVMHIKFSIMLGLKSFQEYNLTFQNKTNMNKIQSKVTCEEIEPYFYEVKLCTIATQIATQPHHHTNPPQPSKINHH
jgi:hypothetical protein